MPPFAPRVEGYISAGNSPSAQLASPSCSPIRPKCVEHHSSPTGARRRLQFTAQAVPSGHLYSSSPPSVLAARDELSRARLDALSVMDSSPAGATMGSSFRRLLTSSHPDIQTLHSILVSLHRSEATPTDLHHASQAIGLLASVASDRNSCADCADMATAILSTLATYPKTRTQLPAHARRQLTDALIEIIGYNTTFSNPQPAIARQPGPLTAVPDTPSSIHAGNLAQLSMNTISALSNGSSSLLSGEVLRRRGRSLSPRGVSTAVDAVSPSARAASVPPAISQSNLIRHSILASPGSPRRQLTSFAQRAIERLQEARQAAHSGTTNTSVPSFIPASHLDIPESLEPVQQSSISSAFKGQIDAVADTAEGSNVRKVLEFDSVTVPQLRNEHEELQESLPGSLQGTHAKSSLPESAARFMQAAVQNPGTSNTAERISTIALSSSHLVSPVNDSDSVGKSASLPRPVLPLQCEPTTAGAAAFLDSQKRTIESGATGVHTPEISYRGPRPVNATSDGSTSNTVAMWPSSLQDSDSEPAMVSALSLVLSKCGLARAGGLKESSTSGSADDGTSGGSAASRSEHSGRRSAEEEASLRRAGRWVLATLAVAAAATADDVIMAQLNSKRFTAMLSGWLDQGDNIQSTTAVLVSLALLEARPKAAGATEPVSLRSDSKESDRPPPVPFHSPPFIDTLATRCSSLITRHSSPFARTLAMRASAACGVVSTRTLRVSDSIDVDIGLRMHDYIVMGLSHLGVTSESAPCTHSLLAPLIPSFHGRGQAPTVAAAAATAVAAISADSVEDLERFVEAGAISGLTRGLVSGHADEAAACAAALAVIARLPSAHSHLLRSGACDVILRCAGSRNKELHASQPGIAAALAHLSCNSSMQFTLVGKGLAGAVCSLITNAPSACMPAVAKVIIAVAREGGMQGAILVRAGIVKELVGFLRRRLPCAHLRSAHASLHALLIHARHLAASEALAAGAIPHLLFALSSSDQKTRKRAARMLSLLLEASASESSAILARLECAAPLMRLLRHGDFAERAEAVDLLYLLRGSTQVMRALGNDDGAALRALAEVLATCTPHQPHAQIRPRPPADITPWQVPPARTTSAAVPASPPATPAAAAAAAAAEAAAAARAQQRRSAAVRHSGGLNNGVDESAGRLVFSSSDGTGSGSGNGSWSWHWDADVPEQDGLTAAEIGLFSSSASIGARINTDAIRGKVVRVLCTMAIHPESRDAVAACSELADPLSRILAHHRSLHNWSSMSQPPLPLPEPERAPSFVAATNSRPANGAFRAGSTNGAVEEVRYDADAEGDSSDNANKNESSQAAGTANSTPVVDISDKVLERIRNLIEVGSGSPPRIRRGLRVNPAESPRMLTVPMSTTYEAAELLLSWLLDMRRLRPIEVLEPLCVQAWLGNNVDLIHSQRFNSGSSAEELSEL